MNVRAAESHPAIKAMKTPRLLILLLTAVFAILSPRPVEARVEVSFDFFYDSLAPYGEWVEVGDYGYCWRPTDVDRDWAPYADGYWAFTDAGWTWVSYEDFGGIVYHYGRWVRTEDEGWCWVPDYEWGPAWVSWRNNDDYVGWAPLPPEARWQPSVGISIWVDRVYDIGPGSYNFCRVRDFGAPVLRPVIINRLENVTIIRRTVNITNITYNTTYGDSPVIYNGGPNYTVINQRSARRVPSLKLVQNRDGNLPGSRDWDRDRDRDRGVRDGRRRNFNAEAVGNQLIVTAPGVRPPTDPGFLKSKVQRVIAADKVTRGWNGVKNDEVRRELKQEMQRQTKGLTPETAPARAVVAADLKVLPEKADPQAVSPVATREKRDQPGQKDRATEGAGPKSGTAGPRMPTAPATATPPAAEDRPTKKTARENERGQSPREQQKPVAGDPSLKPFNPVAETEPNPRREKAPANTPPDPTTDPRPGKPAEDPVRMRHAEREGGVVRERQQERATTKASEEQRKPVAVVPGLKPVGPATEPEPKPRGGKTPSMTPPNADSEPRGIKPNEEAARMRAAERQGEAVRQGQVQAAAREKALADQEKAARRQTEGAARQQQIEAQRKAEAMRERQQGEAAAAARQQMQVEQGRAARQQAEAAAAQQKQTESLRRQQSEQQGAEQQRRQAMEQQRGQRERGEAAEQARRAQDGQREQMRQQADPQRQQRQQPPPRAAQPPPNAPPSGNPAEAEKERRGKKKDD